MDNYRVTALWISMELIEAEIIFNSRQRFDAKQSKFDFIQDTYYEPTLILKVITGCSFYLAKTLLDLAHLPLPEINHYLLYFFIGLL